MARVPPGTSRWLPATYTGIAEAMQEAASLVIHTGQQQDIRV